MQGGDGADDGGERLEDKEITTNLICGLTTTMFLNVPFN